MRGETDDGVGTGDRAGLGDGHVVLADVNAVGATGVDEVGTVVDDEQGAVAIGGGAEGGSGREDPVVVGVLVAELDQIGAAGECGFEQPVECLCVAFSLADEVETGAIDLLGGASASPQA